jgi:hypothetical protein
MKNDVSPLETSSNDTRAGSDAPPTRGRRAARRRSNQTAPTVSKVRFFLSKAESNGTPLLAEEFENESEAMVESLKSGRSYFVISEWKSTADLSKRLPQIRKECVAAKVN